MVRYIGGFYVEMEGLDILTFTGGIGEHSSLVRRLVCQKLSVLGVKLDEAANTNAHGDNDLTQKGSRVRVLVIPTDEEKGIAYETYRFKRA